MLSTTPSVGDKKVLYILGTSFATEIHSQPCLNFSTVGSEATISLCITKSLVCSGGHSLLGFFCSGFWCHLSLPKEDWRKGQPGHLLNTSTRLDLRPSS